MTATADPREDDLGDVLDAVGPRLRALRRRRGVTLAELHDATGISVSTLSRCSGIPSRTPVIQEPHIPCSQESITSTPACCNT